MTIEQDQTVSSASLTMHDCFFRLTLQQSGESSCLRKEVCLQLPTEFTPHDKHSVMIDSGVVIGSGLYDEDGSEGSDQEDGDDETDQTDETEETNEMVREYIKNITKYYGAKSVMRISAQESCQVVRDYYIKNHPSWAPDCDCEGNYKTVQCSKNDQGEVQCWCSSPNGSEIESTRKTINCLDPQTW